VALDVALGMGVSRYGLRCVGFSHPRPGGRAKPIAHIRLGGSLPAGQQLAFHPASVLHRRRCGFVTIARHQLRNIR